ncbi:MAG: DUF1641 domain-containing protein [Proteobacteria bacterium]|nr:DUF1641 domain-containing protein [Pseudomonadota bacterium]
MTNEEKILAKLDELTNDVQEAKRAIMPYVELKKELEPVFNDLMQEVIGKLGGLDKKFKIEDIGDLIGQLLISSGNMAEALKTLSSMIELKKEIEPYSRDIFQSYVSFLHSTLHGIDGEDVKEALKQTLANMGNLAESIRLLNSALEFKKDVGSLSLLFFNDLVDKLEIVKNKGLFTFLKKMTTILEKIGLKFNETDLENAKPIRGVFGMLSALRRSDVQDGLGILIELSSVMAAVKEKPAA